MVCTRKKTLGLCLFIAFFPSLSRFSCASSLSLHLHVLWCYFLSFSPSVSFFPSPQTPSHTHIPTHSVSHTHSQHTTHTQTHTAQNKQKNRGGGVEGYKMKCLDKSWVVFLNGWRGETTQGRRGEGGIGGRDSEMKKGAIKTTTPTAAAATLIT